MSCLFANADDPVHKENVKPKKERLDKARWDDMDTEHKQRKEMDVLP